jgi:hypothetical protein
MIRSYWYFAPIALAAGAVAMGPYGVPFVVVVLAFGIFFGTVSIRGRMLSRGSASPALLAPRGSSAALGGAPRVPGSALASDRASSPPGA